MYVLLGIDISSRPKQKLKIRAALQCLFHIVSMILPKTTKTRYTLSVTMYPSNVPTVSK
jgi:hypothetical protein